MKKWISALSLLALLFTTGCREEVLLVSTTPEGADADANAEHGEHAEPHGEEAHDGHDDHDGHDHDG